jgi:hypothetical protein
MTKEKFSKLHEKICQQMAADLSLADALMVIQKSIDSCVRESIEAYSEQQKEEAFNFFFQEFEVETDKKDDTGKIPD